MIALAHNPFWTALFALDRLNSWLRAEQPIFCPFRSALKPVIYWTKTQSILDASKRWHIGLRRVMVKKPCRTCDGSGSWISWYADRDYDIDIDESRANYGERCRNCSGTGIATLKFVETSIGPIVWHTPAHKWWSSSLDVYLPFPSFAHDGEQHYDLANGWEPLQKGRPLPFPDVERDMLILLDAYAHEVCFALDYHHRIGSESQWRCPRTSIAEAWLHDLFHPTEPKQFERKHDW